MNKKICLFTMAAAFVAILAAAALANLSAGTKAPNFSLPTLDGKTFSLDSSFDKPSKVVVLDIWATWCPPCRAEIPYLVALQNEYKSKGVAVIGVAIDSQKKPVADFVKDQKINYTIVLDPNAEKVGKSYKVSGVPATYIIDKKGIVRFVHSGFPRSGQAEQKAEADKIESEVKKLLAE